MANFDPNRWYQISMADSFLAGNNLVGGELLSLGGTGGSVFMYSGNTSFTDQQWQIFPYNSTNYVLRTHRSGPFGYLAVTYLATEPTPGYTVAATKNASIVDKSMFWSIGPWGDGTFWLSNEANGTAWRLEAKVNNALVMSSNITSLRPGQRFEFQQLETINNSSFSTVVTPILATSTITSPSTILGVSGSSSSATATSNSVTISSPASTSSPSPSSQDKKELSEGASAAIGASIGGLALIITIIIAFVLIRRKKKRAATGKATAELPTVPLQPKELPAEQVSSRHLSTEVPAYSAS